MNIPLLQALQKIAARAFGLKAGDAEPAGLAVVFGAAVGGDGVPEDLAAGAGGLQLGGVCEIAHDGDLGDGADGRRAECADGARGADGGAASKEGRHVSLVN